MAKSFEEWKKDWNDETKAKKWFDKGWKDNPEEAKKWSDLWADPKIAKTWFDSKWTDPEKANEWSQTGWKKPEKAYEWSTVEYNKQTWKAKSALKWKKAKWKDPELALKWYLNLKGTKIKPDIALKWYTKWNDDDCLKDVKDWILAGWTYPVEALLWFKGGWKGNATNAIEYRNALYHSAKKARVPLLSLPVLPIEWFTKKVSSTVAADWCVSILNGGRPDLLNEVDKVKKFIKWGWKKPARACVWWTWNNGATWGKDNNMKEACEWNDALFQPDDAWQWYTHGFDAKSASEWKKIGFADPKKIKKIISEWGDFGQEEIITWLSVFNGDEEVAGKFVDGLINVENVYESKSDAPKAAALAKKWYDAGWTLVEETWNNRGTIANACFFIDGGWTDPKVALEIANRYPRTVDNPEGALKDYKQTNGKMSTYWNGY